MNLYVVVEKQSTPIAWHWNRMEAIRNAHSILDGLTEEEQKQADIAVLSYDNDFDNSLSAKDAFESVMEMDESALMDYFVELCYLD